MQICIASGKGGTGKTTIAVNLAWAISRQGNQKLHLVDCDVEAPNDHLFLNTASSTATPVCLPKPQFIPELCSGCGKCATVCRFNAVTVVGGRPLLFEEMCHACGACAYICPQNAVSTKNARIGTIHSVNSGLPFKLSWGELEIGQVQAPDIIKQLRKTLHDSDINILDAAPGCGCAVRETLTNASITLLVTEPTPFGLNDLSLAAQLSSQMGIPTGIIINRAGENDKIIEDFAEKAEIPILGRIPFSRKYAESYSRGWLLAEKHPEIAAIMQDISQAAFDLAKSRQCATFQTEPRHTTEVIAETEPAESDRNIDEIVVISGKGGTGKTTITAALAAMQPKATFFDADVDASNLPILLDGKTLTTRLFTSGAKARIKKDICIKCGKSASLCQFEAIKLDTDGYFKVLESACEGCGLCKLVCPYDAIEMTPGNTGFVYSAQTDYGKLAHAFLNIGEENSGKLVTQVRNSALSLAAAEDSAGILGDGPPGIGCPVIASITGCRMALVVTEPTCSGTHDMLRALQLTRHFRIKAAVVINKSDINEQESSSIKSKCREMKVPVIGEIPFDENVGRAVIHGLNLVDSPPCPARNAVISIGNKIQEILDI
ncbi:ATP-binding protein [Lentisphaerota bacterium ZTH]|nr:ATP-binding protein [Lentisphaerota bacterium]WET05120.1 ATP-binding protein [Lentisphaerota bacterium ZTH]